MNDTKKEIRRIMRQRRQNLPLAERQDKDAAIMERLKMLPAFQRAQTIMAYASLPEEVQLYDLIAYCRHMGKKILLPALNDNGEMAASLLPKKAIIESGVAWQKRGECFPPEQIDLIIVPGVAFTKVGHRLGMGGGYYDRFLPQATNAAKVALAYDFQIVESLPLADFDVAVEAVVTEHKIYTP